jgi:Uma2 family endonuclease
MLQTSQRPRLIYEVQPVRDDWILLEDKVPESRPHDLVANRVCDLLVSRVRRTGRNAAVCRNLAVRWDEANPAVGVDPDVCVIAPPPPEGDALTSLRLWEAGHAAPLVAVEIVSPTRADKDYVQSPAKYAANGTQELWVFDPALAGSKALGGPHRIQVWKREDNGDFLRVYAGFGPAWSEAMKGWLFAVEEGQSLRIADDEAGTSWWMTGEEAERAAKEEAQRRSALLSDKLRELGVDPDAIE